MKAMKTFAAQLLCLIIALFLFLVACAVLEKLAYVIPFWTVAAAITLVSALILAGNLRRSNRKTK